MIDVTNCSFFSCRDDELDGEWEPPQLSKYHLAIVTILYVTISSWNCIKQHLIM